MSRPFRSSAPLLAMEGPTPKFLRIRKAPFLLSESGKLASCPPPESGPPSPVGMSQASIGFPWELAHSAISEMGCLRDEPGPPPPAPSRQSTIRDQSPSGTDGHTWIPTDSLASLRASEEASDLEWRWLATTAVLPESESERHATKPSPPLFPGPHRNSTPPLGHIADASAARLSPAACISSDSPIPKLRALSSKTATSSQCMDQRERPFMITNVPRRSPLRWLSRFSCFHRHSHRPTVHPGSPRLR